MRVLVVVVVFILVGVKTIGQNILVGCFSSKTDTNKECYYGKDINFIMKTKSEIINMEGKPDSIYIIPNQGIEITYEKTIYDNLKHANKRETNYFFCYKPYSTHLIDTCLDIIIIAPKSEITGWIKYLDEKYPKEKIVDGEDKDSAVGCDKEWEYSKDITICLSEDKQNVTVQLNVKGQYDKNGNAIIK